MKKQILLAAAISDTFREHLEAKGYELVNYDAGCICYDAKGIITSNKLKLDAHRLAKFPHLKWVARLGSGLEIIDAAYCAGHGIALASSPAGIANAVAEHGVGLLIALQKNMATSFLEVKNKQWIREPNRGWELEGKTVGLIGYGNTGRAFAKKLSVFNVKTIAYDKYQIDFSDEYVEAVRLIELQKMADIISFHVPLNEETKYYYNHDFIAHCQPHILVNMARGAVVSNDALLQGLKEKRILGAALDVLENEHELQQKDPEAWKIVQDLLPYPVIITPHIAGYSHNAIEKMSAELLEKLKDKF